jgi:beta-glucosidase
MATIRRFPDGFMWGAGTSSYQVEGGVHEDGRGDSIWDVFAHTPGRVANDEHADVTSDHYHRWREDVDILAKLGLGAYRFSLAWPRIQPDGRGAPNPAGLAFYDRLVDALLERGIQPCPTLYHWDLPQALDEGGGWLERSIVDRFAEYAAICFGALDDRVRTWFTVNEPWVASTLGYRLGIHAPGHRDLRESVVASHHLLLAHGAAVAAYRAAGASGGGLGRIGIVLSLAPTYPASGSHADAAAARGSDGYTNRWYLDPVLRGRYPTDMLDYFGRHWPLDAIRDGDAKRIGQAIDFLGVNYYARRVVRAPGPGEAAEYAWVVRSEGTTGIPTSDLGWEMTPDAFLDLLLRLKGDYEPMPIFITENGCSLNDVIAPDGAVHDPRRIEFLRTHLLALEEAILRGVDVRGYFAWSLMDNFEWAEGYAPRFGITYVDYPTQRRIPKDSARWLGDVARRNALR